MQLEQTETFELHGPQLEVFGQLESKLPAPARKRPAAAVVLAAALLVAVFGVGGVQLKSKQARVAAQYTATDEHGFSLKTDLDSMADAAANLIRICGAVVGENDPDYTGALQALDAWNAADEQPDARYAAKGALTTGCEALYNAARVAADQDTRGRLDGLHDEMTSIVGIIDREAGANYNVAVEDFNRTLSGFPANMIGTLWGVDAVPLFG